MRTNASGVAGCADPYGFAFLDPSAICFLCSRPGAAAQRSFSARGYGYVIPGARLERDAKAPVRSFLSKAEKAPQNVGALFLRRLRNRVLKMKLACAPLGNQFAGADLIIGAADGSNERPVVPCSA